MKHGLAVLTGVALFCSTIQAALPAEAFDEIHFGVLPETRLVAVKVIARDQGLWNLWPEEVKVEHVSRLSQLYVLSYQKEYNVHRIVRSASTDSKISASCQSELKVLLEAPKEMIPDSDLTTTIYLPLDEEHPDRLALQAGSGLRLVSVETLSKTSEVSGTALELGDYTRALFVKLSFMGTYSSDYGISDIASVVNPETGKLQIVPQKEGITALKKFGKDKRLTEGCWKEVVTHYWGPPTDNFPSSQVSKKTVTTVIRISDPAARALTLEPLGGFSVESVELLD
jgi:hypothetical protein